MWSRLEVCTVPRRGQLCSLDVIAFHIYNHFSAFACFHHGIIQNQAIRASPIICQIWLAFFIVGKNVENTPLTVLNFLATWEKPASSMYSIWHRRFLLCMKPNRRVKQKIKNAEGFLMQIYKRERIVW